MRGCDDPMYLVHDLSSREAMADLHVEQGILEYVTYLYAPTILKHVLFIQKRTCRAFHP